MATISISDGPYIQHFSPAVGATLSRSITFWEGDPLALTDITADTFSMVVEYLDTGELLYDLTLGNGIEFVDDNTIRWTITDDQSAAWEPPRVMRYAIVRTKANGTVIFIAAGSIKPQKYKIN